MGNQHLILLSNCKGNQVSFGGDGKYGSYTCMDLDIDTILDTQLYHCMVI